MCRKIYIKGFTLIELLIVIFIISLVSQLIIMNNSNIHNVRALKSFANLLKSQIIIAKEQSILQMSTLALSIRKTHYLFYRYDEKSLNQWIELAKEDSFWLNYTIPRWIEATVLSDNTLFGRNKSEISSKIMFFPSGEITPFVINLKGKNLSNSLQIVGETSGNIYILEKYVQK